MDAGKFDKEYHVVYIMVQLRKLLDQIRKTDAQNKYALIRFFCDWTVHIKKDIMADGIKLIMERINKSVPKGEPCGRLNFDEHIYFVYMKALNEELLCLFRKEGLPVEFLEDRVNWLLFVRSLVNVLIEQPIYAPVPEMEYFCFKRSDNGAFLWHIKFKDEREICTFLDEIDRKIDW